jgi:hypothetical protein
MKRFKRLLRLVGGTALLAGLLVAPAAPVSAHEGDSLSAVRHATARFHSVEAANKAGYYDPGLPCFDKIAGIGAGGMGLHLINFGLADGTLIPTKPQSLVYEVDGDDLNLVAVEYLVPISFPKPTLFGQVFHQAHLPNGGAALPFWALHAWIWESNPYGMFADYNPEVAMCPGHTSGD